MVRSKLMIITSAVLGYVYGVRRGRRSARVVGRVAEAHGVETAGRDETASRDEVANRDERPVLRVSVDEGDYLRSRVPSVHESTPSGPVS